MEDNKNIRKTFLFSPELVEVIKKLKEDMHQNSDTAVVIEAINSLNRKINPGYVVARSASASKTPEDRADEQLRIQEIKKKREEDALLAIAEKLGGRVSLDDGGQKIVKYFTYARNTRFLQQMPLTMMTDELVEHQYFPSRVDIEKRQAEGKVTYKVGSWEE